MKDMKIGLMYFAMKVYGPRLEFTFSMCNNLSFSHQVEEFWKIFLLFFSESWKDSRKLDQIRYSYGRIYYLNGRFVFPGLEKRIQIGVEIEAEDEADPRKQSHPFGDRYPVVGTRLPYSRRELHSRVYHCPDNNDLPMALVRGTRPTGEERETKGREGWEAVSHLAFRSISL